ncbi:MAG: oligosaccharide flippase family protein [Ilumatobacteraceae bacterium]|nr:oligosaccharide flippase family protein [Ilumatobacteraceae bacterium]
MHEVTDDAPPAAEHGDSLERASFGRNVAHMMSSQVFTWTLATVTSFIISRYIGAAGRGQVSVATAVWTIGGIAIGLGLSSVLQLELATNRATGLRLVGPILVVRTVAFVLVGGVIALYLWLTGADQTVVGLAAIVSVGALLGTWSDALGSVFVGLERMAATALTAASVRVIGTLGVIAVVVLDLGIYAVVAVSGVASLWGLCQLALRFRQISSVHLRDWPWTARQIVRAGLPFVSVFGALVLYQQVDVIVISFAASDTELGWYSASDILFGSLLFPATVTMGVLFPTLGRRFAEDPQMLDELVENAFSRLLIASVPIGLGTTLTASTVMPLLNGDDYRRASDVLAVLGPVIILTFGTILFGTVALATQRGSLWAMVLVGAAATTIPLDLLLVPLFRDRYGNGAIGGSVAYLVTETVQFVIGLLLIAPHLLNRRVGTRVVKVGAAGGAMFATGWALEDTLMIAQVAVCAAVYVAAIFLLRVLDDTERSMVSAGIGRVRSRF